VYPCGVLARSDILFNNLFDEIQRLGFVGFGEVVLCGHGVVW
jgi:hypothetical protein